VNSPASLLDVSCLHKSGFGQTALGSFQPGRAAPELWPFFSYWAGTPNRFGPSWRNTVRPQRRPKPRSGERTLPTTRRERNRRAQVVGE